MTYSSTATRPAPQPTHYHRVERSQRHPVFAMPAVGRTGRLTPPPVSRPQVRTARTRLIAVVAILVFVVVMVASTVGADSGPVPTTRHHVAAGETLWSLASAMTPPGESVWEYVALIKDINGLEESSLQIDQVLLVPTATE